MNYSRMTIDDLILPDKQDMFVCQQFELRLELVIFGKGSQTTETLQDHFNLKIPKSDLQFQQKI